MLRHKAVLAVVCCSSVLGFAANVFSPSAKYNAAVATLEASLGYRVGEAFTPYSALETYYQKLAASSDRVKLQPYGKSVEGRTLYTVFISSPRNLARLEVLRQSWLKLTDPRTTTVSDAQSIAANTPVLVWLSYNVHGNEASSSEAAMQVAYELAASEADNVLNWLEQCVIVIDPVLNPDGRDRYVNFYRQWQGRQPRLDRFAAEHQERWPGGRVNHYLFDLNRDWAWQSQQESVARVRTMRNWAPQVHVDFHEMNPSATYFFPPPAKPVLPSLAPLLGKWWEIFGRANAAAFDRFQFQYYTRESYDFFYPSYGDIWPALNGAVGMTYEQGGGGSAGLSLELPEQQRTLTLRDRVSHHFVASLTTIETAAKNREARLRDYYNFRRAAIESGQKGPIRTYYIVPGPDVQRTVRVVDVLMKQGIEVKRAEAEVEAGELNGYFGDKVARKKLPAGTYIVDLAQPAGFLARALLERDITPDAVFFYDVSSWSLPLLADVESYWSATAAPANARLVSELPSVPGGVQGPERATSYIIPIEQTAGLRLLSHLLNEDFKAYVSVKPVRTAGQRFAAGSIIIPADSNPPTVHQRLRALAAEDGAQVFGMASLMVEEGVDLGSTRVRYLRKPKIAVLTDAPVGITEYGALWHLLENRMDIPFTPIRTEELRNTDLRSYNVLVLPPDTGDGRDYSRVLDKALTARITDWVREGGLLIGLRGGAVWAAKNRSGLTSVKYRYVRDEDDEARVQEERASKDAKDREKDKDEESDTAHHEPSSADAEKRKQAELDRKLTRYTDREQKRRAEDIPGAMLRVVLDNTHPIGFGMGERLAVLDDTAPILELSARGENPAYFPAGPARVSGFITPENEKKLGNSAYIVRERVGKGTAVLFAETPVFRGFSDATSRLLLNALFFGNIVDPNLE